MGIFKREDQVLLQAKKRKNKRKGKNGKKKNKHDQTKAEVIDPEQKVGWTWMNPKGKTAGHTTRWIKRRMIDRAVTN